MVKNKAVSVRSFNKTNTVCFQDVFDNSIYETLVASGYAMSHESYVWYHMPYHTIFTFEFPWNVWLFSESCCQQARRSRQAFDAESSRSRRESAQLKAMTDSQLTVTRWKISAADSNAFHTHSHTHTDCHGVKLKNMLMTFIYSWHY